MKRALLMTVVLLVLLPGIAKAQWTFDINSSSVHHQGRKNHLRGISAHTRKKKRDSKWNSGRCI